MPYSDPEKQRQAKHESYLRNQLKIKEAGAISRSNHRNKLRALVNSLKENQPCTDCGVIYPCYVLDYHHNGDKISSVGKMVGKGEPIQRVLDEIAKCDLLCANCHRIRTHG